MALTEIDRRSAIGVQNVSKKYCKTLKRSMLYGLRDISRNVLGLTSHSDRLRRDEFWALDDISFELLKGEALGVIGPNGSGKTTLLKLLNGVFWPDRGKIRVEGRVGSLIEVGAGFHPLLTGRENIFVNGAILGMNKHEIKRKFETIVDFAELGDFIDAPVKHYSSGMFVRLGFAIAVHCEPNILLIDEILAVGDLSFKKKCFKKLAELRQKKISWIIVSHDHGTIKNQCERVIFLRNGKIRYIGKPESAINEYLYQMSEEIQRQQEVKPDEDNGQKEEAKITGVMALDENGNEKDFFKTGEALVLKIDYLAFRRVEQPVLGILVYGSDDSVLSGINTRLSGFEIPYIEGRGTVFCKIPHLSLVSGIYTIRVDLCDKSVGIIDKINRAVHLKVKGGGSGVGLFDMEHEWEFKPMNDHFG